jgi:nitrogenase subunit NifH
MHWNFLIRKVFVYNPIPEAPSGYMNYFSTRNELVHTIFLNAIVKTIIEYRENYRIELNSIFCNRKIYRCLKKLNNFSSSISSENFEQRYPRFYKDENYQFKATLNQIDPDDDINEHFIYRNENIKNNVLVMGFVSEEGISTFVELIFKNDDVEKYSSV